jgi:hypothetical protein
MHSQKLFVLRTNINFFVSGSLLPILTFTADSFDAFLSIYFYNNKHEY